MLESVWSADLAAGSRSGSVQRFSGRAQNYTRFRPAYPPGIVTALHAECGLSRASLIADVGAGTGHLATLFLENGNRVFAVEPNEDMRKAGEERLGHYGGFQSVAGIAEATTLAEASVDFVVAGQALHWFDPERARREFARILRKDGWVAVIWNQMHITATPFLRRLGRLLEKYAIDRPTLDHRERDATVSQELFRPNRFAMKQFAHQEHLDLRALEGRLLSFSYVPHRDHPSHSEMLRELTSLFVAHEAAGRVEFFYTATMFYGRIAQLQS